MIHRLLSIIIMCICVCAGAHSQVRLTRGGNPQGRIIYSDSRDAQGAAVLASFLEKISGAKVPVVRTDAPKPRKGDVVIARVDDPAITEDGFRITTPQGRLLIESTKGRGSLYAVTELLERWLGCNYWSDHEYTAPANPTIDLPAIDLLSNPAFRYRQSQNYAMATDTLYRHWMRLEEPREEFINGMFVHTFDRLLPSAVYGESHPEYYAYFDGARHPGKASQWCLTNPEVFEIVAARLDSIFKANPGLDMISVSQNDGNYTNCTCPECARIDSIEGGPSGSLIHFLNRLADRFPDKQFSTLAYLYTMHPPKHVKPRPNVNIMLCDIDCYREVPLQYNASGRDFLKALDGWSAITDNIYIWDYGINFDGTSTPFPNFHIIQPNIQTFKHAGATMHFSQLGGLRGGDMSELRTWLVAKLMWNPEADVDSLITTFTNGYYGPAGPYIKRYLRLQEGALLGSRIPLWIYDSPVTHKDGMFNPNLMRMYNDLFDQAEAAVAHDTTLLDRVRRSRLPLQYVELELARTSPDKDLADIYSKLDTFEQRSIKYGLTTLNERNNSPIDYCHLYKERYLPRTTANKAAGASVTFSRPVPAPYDRIASTALTDGLYGGATYKDAWIGWEGTDVDITVDLGKPTEFTTVTADFLQQLGAWILQPLSVTFAISTDGTTFTPLNTAALEEDTAPQVKFVPVTYTSPTPLEAQYIRLSVEATKYCPHWHYGVGNVCWVFLDEITVE